MATTGETTAPCGMGQSAEVGGALLQLVHTGSDPGVDVGGRNATRAAVRVACWPARVRRSASARAALLSTPASHPRSCRSGTQSRSATASGRPTPRASRDWRRAGASRRVGRDPHSWPRGHRRHLRIRGRVCPRAAVLVSGGGTQIVAAQHGNEQRGLVASPPQHSQLATLRQGGTTSDRMRLRGQNRVGNDAGRASPTAPRWRSCGAARRGREHWREARRTGTRR